MATVAYNPVTLTERLASCAESFFVSCVHSIYPSGKCYRVEWTESEWQN